MAARLADINHVEPLSGRHDFARLPTDLDIDDPAGSPSPAARGILIAVMLSIQLWALIAVTLYLLR